jgi:hypothetical protein
VPSNEQDNSSPLPRPATSGERLCWRSWPCHECAQGTTAISHVFGCCETDPRVWTESPEEIAREQISALATWGSECEHGRDSCETVQELTGGSEHLVFLREEDAQIYKLTRPGIFGETYYFDGNRLCQRNCSPVEYLIRLHLWKKLFRSAPIPLGIGAHGGIVSVQQFIQGRKPRQQDVDALLSASGLTAVKLGYWLWKKTYPHFEIWIGDARDDNFVETNGEIVPIDIRIWFSSLAIDPSNLDFDTISTIPSDISRLFPSERS